MAQRRLVNRQNMVGNTRMDAALDAMGQFGFKRKLVRETVDELLDVYEGKQGWPFIEEASYKLLIETILAKQQSSLEEKDNTRKDGVSETASAAIATTGITEVGSTSLVVQNSVLQARDDLDSAYQTSDHHGPPPLDVKDTTLPIKRGVYGRGVRVESINKQKSMDATLPTQRVGDGRGIRVETKNKQKSMDIVRGSSHKTYAYNVKKTVVRSSVMESSKTADKPMDNAKGSNDEISASSAKKTILRSPMIESAFKHDKLMNNENGSNHRTFVKQTVVRSSVIGSSKTPDKLMDNAKGSNHEISASSANKNTILRSSMIESASKQDKLMNNEKGSNHRTFVNKVENTVAGNSMIESSKTRDELPQIQCRPCYGWIGSDNDVDLIYFPVPELPEHLKKLIAQNDGSQTPRSKSRWDEKEDDM